MAYEGGFQGRTNKLVDGCYSTWQGAVFSMLDHIIHRTSPTHSAASTLGPAASPFDGASAAATAGDGVDSDRVRLWGPLQMSQQQPGAVAGDGALPSTSQQYGFAEDIPPATGSASVRSE